MFCGYYYRVLSLSTICKQKIRRIIDGWAGISFRRKLFHYLAGFQATGADLDPFWPPVDSGVDVFQIYVETALPDIVRVADSIAKTRLFPAYFTSLSHRILQTWANIYLFGRIARFFADYFDPASIPFWRRCGLTLT